MAKVIAIAKQTLAGEYGKASEGDEITLLESHAKELEARGLVTITGPASTEEVKEKRESSFSITDNTGKAKEKAEQETDEKDPTGNLKEKNDKAGPSVTKQAPQKSTKK